VVGQAKAACGSGEIMIGAYCTGDNASLKMEGMAGAECQERDIDLGGAIGFAEAVDL
jgi:hypothetical protein